MEQVYLSLEYIFCPFPKFRCALRLTSQPAATNHRRGFI